MKITSPHNKSQKVSALSFDLGVTAGPEVHLLPDGYSYSDDGRQLKFYINPEIASRVVALAEKRERDTVIDYEHQTLVADVTGIQAPAAGWFRTLAYREGEGLFITDARWTAKAKAYIEAEEYRYVSVVALHNPDTGEVYRVLHASLTNEPAMDGLNELEKRAAAKFEINDQPDEEDPPMNEEQLKLLGLKKDATEEEVTAALKAKLGELDGATEQVAALKGQLEQAGNPDPSKYVPVAVVEELKIDLAALKATQTEGEVEQIVALAMQEGKLLKAQEQWAKDLGKSDLAALKAYVESAQSIAALKGNQTDSTKPPEEGEEIKLTDTQIGICKATGVSQEQYLATLKSEQQTAG